MTLVILPALVPILAPLLALAKVAVSAPAAFPSPPSEETS